MAYASESIRRLELLRLSKELSVVPFDRDVTLYHSDTVSAKDATD